MFLIIMAAVHVPTPLSHAFQEMFGFTSSAEGFIFLGGCLAGFVYGKAYLQGDWLDMFRRVWIRIKMLYIVHVSLVVPIAVIALAGASWLPPLANHFHDLIERPWGSLALLPLLLHQPPLFDILPLYVVFLALTPFLLVMARRSGWGVVLLSSLCIWVVAQNGLLSTLVGGGDTVSQTAPVAQFAHAETVAGHPHNAQVMKWKGFHAQAASYHYEPANSAAGGSAPASGASPFHWSAFNLLAWQFLWVFGIAAGESSLRRPLVGKRGRAWVAACAGVVVLVGFLARHGLWPEAWFSPSLYLWMDKWTLGPLRLLNFGAWVLLLAAWNPRPPRILLELPALLGRHSLSVFAFHLPLVIAATTAIQMLAAPAMSQTAFGLTVIAAMFVWATWLDRRRKQQTRTALLAREAASAAVSLPTALTQDAAATTLYAGGLAHNPVSAVLSPEVPVPAQPE
jgi:hypothetical protein